MPASRDPLTRRKLEAVAVYLENVGRLYCLGLAEQTLVELHFLNPVDTGHSTASYTAGVNGRAPGFPEQTTRPRYSIPNPLAVAASGFAGFQLGDTLAIGNRAGHTGIIAGGRRMGSHGRMIGSLQRPQPYLQLAVQRAIQKMQGERL